MRESFRLPQIIQGQIMQGQWCINISSTEVSDSICHKKTFQHFQGDKCPPPFAHAYGRRWLCTQLYILHVYACSATHGDLQVPRTRTVTYGPRSFAVSGPTIWNTLPSTLRVSTTKLGQFQSRLKTILFRLAYGTWLGAFVTD